MKKLISFLTIFLLLYSLAAQDFTSSNLPIVVINTDGGIAIPDEPKIGADMKIIFRPDGSRNFLTDIDSAQFLNYDGRIKIEIRGQTSQQFFDKKSYGLKTVEPDNESNNNVSILGMPKEHDWILNSLAFDATYIRDFLSYELSERLGQYSTRRVYCEVVINGDYQGLYVFLEKIKVDKNRVNISEEGYITKADKYSYDEPVAWTMPSYCYPDPDFVHHYPKPDEIQPTQNQYIHDVFFALADAAHDGDESKIDGFPSIIDIPTFIDFMIIGEFASNVDVYQLSTFFHKDNGGKLRAGPVWDYNLAYGFDAFGYRSLTDVWQFSNYDNEGPMFWTDLFENETFKCYFSRRWNELTSFGQPLNYNMVSRRIDAIVEMIHEAADRDNQRWYLYYDQDYEISMMKSWIEERIEWITNNIGLYQNCSDVEVPNLVISKINYHPMDYGLIDGERLEFIEITNNSDDIVDLTGLYFRELGISYVFPESSIAAHDSLILASDTLAFRIYYNTVPFAQYERNLSNKSQNLVLADAWGNVIDEVHYCDSLPWNPEADGGGAYLQLLDLDLDNNNPENWIAGYDLTGINEKSNTDNISVFPNPTDGIITIKNGNNDILNVQIIDIMGNIIIEKIIKLNNTTLDLAEISSGLYFLRVQTIDGNINTIKIILQ